MKSIKFFAVVLVLAMVLVACDLPFSIPGITSTTATESPVVTVEQAAVTETPATVATEKPADATEPPTTTGGNVPGALLQDDFSNESSGWEIGNYTIGSCGYSNGAYQISANGATQESGPGFIWCIYQQDFTNTSVDVDVTQVLAGATDNNGYGVFCRMNQDAGYAYALMISGDGFYSIQRWDPQNVEYLVEWTPSSVIHQGNASNHIRAICDGTSFTLIVNDETLATATDSTYATGWISFLAQSFEASPTVIQYDNLVVTEPTH